jgi:3'-phosphoadenosine 5'-phosphosulfate sulfotransferase (PAPS reductase)/FAD synthetase
MQKLTIISVSGGKDSTALYLLAQEFCGNNFLPVFADTGNEHPVTVNYVKNLHHMANGPKVQIVKADFSKVLDRKNLKSKGNQFLDLMIWKGRAPSIKAQFCTEHLKLWPILFYLEKNFPREKYSWEMLTGLRQKESLKRSKINQPFLYNSFFDCQSVLPLLYEEKTRIFDFLKEKEVPPNPLYAIGFNRVGCFPCIHSNKKELSLLPEWAWEKLEFWEKKLGRNWFPPGILSYMPKGHIPKCSEIKEWCMTTHGAKYYDLFKKVVPEDPPACMSNFIRCE